MMVAGKSLSELLMRLAQKSRAAGIHAIFATQRPSVKVITGDIKANLPARISYRVAQQEDSKTILGRVGAERLLGCGDSLCNLPNEKALKRVHGPFVSDEDVAAVCDHLRAQAAVGNDPARENVASVAAPKYHSDSTELAPEDAELYERAVEYVAAAGRCSATMLQNALGLGWAKASKVVSWLERDGIVGPAPRGKNAAREVYVRPR
jgi:S-DNA-T family DNA segregation ATPase FtsK/SpoIIIE